MSVKIGAEAAIAKLTDWSIKAGERDAIVKTYRFSDFKTAWGFMSAAALKAEQMDHHPEWFNVYSTVEVTLTTHDASGVTDLDVTLASYMDKMAAKLS